MNDQRKKEVARDRRRERIALCGLPEADRERIVEPHGNAAGLIDDPDEADASPGDQ